MKALRIDPPAVAVALFVSALLLFGGVGIASAAVDIQGFGFTVNGKSSATVEPGDSIDVGFAVDVDGGDEVEYAQVRLINSNGDIVKNACEKVGTVADVSDKEMEVSVDVPEGVAEGEYDVFVRLFGIAGLGQSNKCDTDNAVDSATFTDRLFVDADGDGEVGGDSTLASLMAQVQALAKLVAALTNPTVPAASAKCAALNAKLVGTVDNTYNQANLQLQGYLLSEGMSIPALAAGASFGYKGSQTNTAISVFKSSNACI